ncbi:unnamed protein product [Urochloa humidicola]
MRTLPYDDGKVASRPATTWPDPRPRSAAASPPPPSWASTAAVAALGFRTRVCVRAFAACLLLPLLHRGGDGPGDGSSRLSSPCIGTSRCPLPPSVSLPDSVLDPHQVASYGRRREDQAKPKQ